MVTILNENSLFIPVVLEKKEETVKTLTLIDSGAGGKFIDKNFAKKEEFELKYLETPLVVYNINGTLNKKGTIRKYVELPMTIYGRKTTEQLFVRELSTVIQKVERLDDLEQKRRKPVAKLNSKVGIFYPHLTLIYYSACDRLSNNS